MYNTNTGNIGVGTNAPQTGFHIHGKTLRISANSSNAYLLQGFTTGAVNDNIGISMFDGVNTNSPYLWIAKAGDPWGGPAGKMVIASSRNSGVTKDLWIYANDNLAPSVPNLLIQANTGKVGVGTAAPSAKFHVVDGNNQIRIGDVNGSSTPVIELADIGPVQIEGFESDMRFLTSGTERFRITSVGNIGIGTSDTKGYKLAVNGDAIFTKIKVKTYSAWPDYVFHSTYKLPSLREVEMYIKRNRHLPGVVSASEVEEKGLDLGNNQAILLKKIEELTLYVIEQNKQLEKMKMEIAGLKTKRK